MRSIAKASIMLDTHSVPTTTTPRSMKSMNIGGAAISQAARQHGDYWGTISPERNQLSPPSPFIYQLQPPASTHAIQ
jgi:hypothetical protein